MGPCLSTPPKVMTPVSTERERISEQGKRHQAAERIVSRVSGAADRPQAR